MRSLITVWAQAEHMLWRGTYQSTSLSSKLCKQQWQWHRLSSWVATARDNFAMLSLITVWAQVENISDNGNPAINIIDNTEASLCDNNVGYNNGLLIHCVTVTWRRLISMTQRSIKRHEMIRRWLRTHWWPINHARSSWATNRLLYWQRIMLIPCRQSDVGRWWDGVYEWVVVMW